MNKSILTYFFLLIILSCNLGYQYPNDTELQLYLHDMAGQIDEILLNADIPANLTIQDPAKNGSEIDINNIFITLDKLSVEAGYLLDYVYNNDGFLGYPVCYIHEENSTPFNLYSDYEAAISNSLLPSLDAHILTDGTDKGFLQLALFHLLSGRFYLFGHARYEQVNIIATYTDLENSIPSRDSYIQEIMPDSYLSFVNAVRRIDIHWTVETTGSQTSVELVTFSPFYGYEKHVYVFSNSFPHTIQNYTIQTLVYYDCGLSY